MATHSSILAWEIPWAEEPGGLQSTGLQESDTTEQLKINNLLQGTHQGSVQFIAQSCLTLQPPGLQPSRLPCPSPTPRAYSNSWPSSQQWHPTTLSSVVPLSSCLQSFPASGSSPVTQFFASGGQSIGASALASVLPMKIQD